MVALDHQRGLDHFDESGRDLKTHTHTHTHIIYSIVELLVREPYSYKGSI
jgi:hypothetical protein